MDNVFVGNVGSSGFQWNFTAGRFVQCLSPLLPVSRRAVEIVPE